MQPRRIIVLGASAGGVSALRHILSEIEPSIPAAIFVVIHTSPDSDGLASALSATSRLPVKNAAPEPFQTGTVYVAPPNCHLMLEREAMQVFRGPRENMHRPSIDVLFRSAAFAYRSRVIGVVLTGMLDDGTAGLFQIKRYGGTAVVQDPNDAEFNSMPLNACAHVKVDYVVPLAKIASLLNRLAGDPLASPAEIPQSRITYDDMIKQNVKSGKATSYTCPECSGPLLEIKEGDLVRFRCRLGHGFGSESLRFAQGESTESILYSALQAVTGKVEFEDELQRRARAQGDEVRALRTQQRSIKLQRAVELLKEAIDLCGENESPD
jgi:two-component system chemotaxis response regulator CheB